MVYLEEVYAFGLSCIEATQAELSEFACFFKIMNKISSPYTSYERVVPLISVFDSVFATQLLLCLSFTGWIVRVIKWWLQEDRPYWWMHQTCYYSKHNKPRPKICTTKQTCETGPGSPSGHSAVMAVQAAFFLSCMQRVFEDRKVNYRPWYYVTYPIAAAVLVSSMIGRMFVAAHFPHQVLFGAALGLILTPYLCIHVANPTIWGPHHYSERMTTRWHMLGAVAITGISVLTAQSIRYCGRDPLWTIETACRWCPDPAYVKKTVTPLDALVRYTGCLFGWALAATPAVDRYRHYTRNRSVLIAIAATVVVNYGLKRLLKIIEKQNYPEAYYIINFIVNALKPVLYLRIIPLMAMYPYDEKAKQDFETQKNEWSDIFSSGDSNTKKKVKAHNKKKIGKKILF